MFVTLLSLFVFLASILYLFLVVRHGYWKNRNIPGPVPTLLGGNTGDIFSGKKSFADIFEEIYRQYRNYPFVGIYKIFTPAIFLIDLEVVKSVLIKDFTNFGNNTLAFSSSDLLIRRNPFVLKLPEWKPVRQQLASLLSISKIRSAITIFNNSARGLVNFIENKVGKDIDAKDFSIRYTTSNVVSWVLGIEIQGFEEEPTEIIKLTKRVFQLTFFQNLSFIIGMIFPPLTPILDTRIISRSVEKRLCSIVLETIQHRINNNIERNDYLGSLISLKRSGVLTDGDIISHVGTVFVDGTDTSANVLHFVLYELAANPETQDILKKEIDEMWISNEGETISFESIQGMKYLDALMNEALRLHLVLPFLSKQTTKECTLSGTANDGQQFEVNLKAGTEVIVPVYSLHMDERYFPEPSAFKPERFLAENKDNIPKCSFLPFGDGPRACLGKMFGSYQIKVGVVYLIKNFRISLADGTPYPLVIDPTQFLPLPKEPIKIKFERWEK